MAALPAADETGRGLGFRALLRIGPDGDRWYGTFSPTAAMAGRYRPGTRTTLDLGPAEVNLDPAQLLN